MVTLTLKKKPATLTKTARRRNAKNWLKNNFVFYRDKLHPWKQGIAQDVKNIYRDNPVDGFTLKDISFALYIRRNFAKYDESLKRVDINGEYVDDNQLKDTNNGQT